MDLLMFVVLYFWIGFIFYIIAVHLSEKLKTKSFSYTKASIVKHEVNYSSKKEFELDINEAYGKCVLLNTFYSRDLKFCCTLYNKQTGEYKTLKESSKAMLELAAGILIDVWRQEDEANVLVKSIGKI